MSRKNRSQHKKPYEAKGKRQDEVLKASVADAKAQADQRYQQNRTAATNTSSQKPIANEAKINTTDQTENKPEQNVPADNKEEKVLNAEGTNQEQKRKERDLNVSAAERIQQIEGELLHGNLTADEANDLRNELDSLKEAQLGTKTDEKDKAKEDHKGEKFSKGDVIEYLYDQFLEFLSWGFDHVEAFMLASGERFGKFLGDGVRNIIDGGKNLAHNIKEQNQMRDFKNAAKAIDSMYEKEVKFYQDRRDFAVKNLKEAVLLGQILAKGSSLDAIDAQYNALKGKKKLTPEEESSFALLKEIMPKRSHVDAERKNIFQKNLKKRAEKYGPILSDAVMPRKGETKDAFASRFKGNIGKINATIDNCVTLCGMQKQAAYTTKLQTLADYGRDIDANRTSEEKTKIITGIYMNNSKEIFGQIRENFGDIKENGLSEEDKSRYDSFLLQRNEKSIEICKKNAKCLEQNLNLEERKGEMTAELKDMHSITVPEITAQKKQTEPKKEGLHDFAPQYNEISPIEVMYKKASARVREAEEKMKRNEERKAQAQAHNERKGYVNNAVNRVINNKSRE